ncbi:hypothetical protein EGW08_011774 [Elysia chlorotica]|uniref:Uncharacterized protein n=1 Tax=Elysia chlorotica TaxID=188477 RepID=A0A3S0ZQK7_ELYCH|nr:hypothetical protein EGW08_011774 [Elysia chlorotica]
METRDFYPNWRERPKKTKVYGQGRDDPFTFKMNEDDTYHMFDEMPQSGYQAVFFSDNQFILETIKRSTWIDQNTRHIIIEFSLINPSTHILSNIRIFFDFKRMAPYWRYSSYHFYFEIFDNYVYFNIILNFTFLLILMYHIIKEVIKVYKMGPLQYLQLTTSYIEMVKIVLSLLLIFSLLMKLSFSFSLIERFRNARYGVNEGYIDFSTMACYDYTFNVSGGVLGCLCIVDIFRMLSKIRRLLTFLRLLRSASIRLGLPVLALLAFTALSYVLFSSTQPAFSTVGLSFMTVTQYFIKPQKLAKSLAETHPFVGPWYLFFLGFWVNFCVVNFFIAFLNETYSSVLNQVRIATYKLRDRTKLEYMYEFLGMRSTLMWDMETDLLMQDETDDRDLLVDMKRLQGD